MVQTAEGRPRTRSTLLRQGRDVERLEALEHPGRHHRRIGREGGCRQQYRDGDAAGTNSLEALPIVAGTNCSCQDAPGGQPAPLG